MRKLLIFIFVTVFNTPTFLTAQVKPVFQCKPLSGKTIIIYERSFLDSTSKKVLEVTINEFGEADDTELPEGLYAVEFMPGIKINTAFDAGEQPELVYDGREIKINNSEAHQLYTRFEIKREQHFKQTVKPIRTQAEDAEKQNDTAMVAELTRNEQQAYNKHRDYLITYAYENMRGSIAALEVMTRRRSGKGLRELEEVVKSVQKKYPENEAVRHAMEELEILQNTLVGARAPGFSSKNLKGKEKSLNKLYGKKGTLIEFWASWCMPCRRMTPEMNSIIEDYEKRGISFIFVSLDTKESAWRSVIEKDEMLGSHLCDFQGYGSEPVNNYGVTSVPAGFLLDATGRIVAKDIKGDVLRMKLEELTGK